MAPVPTSSTYASQIRSDTGSGLGNPDHLRHRSLRSEIRPPPPRFRTGKEESSKERVKDGARPDCVRVCVANAIQMREVVWGTQTTCAIVHFGPKPPPAAAPRGPQRSRDFGPERKSLLRGKRESRRPSRARRGRSPTGVAGTAA